VRWRSVLDRFTAAGYRRPLLTFLLSLDGAGFGPVPVAARLDSLTRLHCQLVSLQARSSAAMWINHRVINCAVLLKGVVSQRGRRRAVLDQLVRKTGRRTPEVLRHLKCYARKLAASIREFGFLIPILVDSEDRIIAGHARVEAARLLELAQVRTVQICHLSDYSQIRAFRIADNRLAELATWDESALALELQDLGRARARFQPRDLPGSSTLRSIS
jgi:hypothetical protein